MGRGSRVLLLYPTGQPVKSFAFFFTWFVNKVSGPWYLDGPDGLLIDTGNHVDTAIRTRGTWDRHR
jgi:hypothetical protein